MPDDKSKVGERDRSKVAADQDYEVSDFAQKYGISSDEARKLIERFGNDREKLYAVAETLKTSFLIT
jgi:Protein of unknown function (DUF3606)